MHVAKIYGMIQPGESSTKAVRVALMIDPKGMIRAIVYYPLTTGRNFDELKKSIDRYANSRSILEEVKFKYGESIKILKSFNILLSNKWKSINRYPFFILL